MRCLWETSTFSVTKIFTPSHSWLPQQWQYPQEQQRKELRHKERYTVSNAQRITAIFTTEKLTQYSPLQYNKRHKGFIKLPVTDNRNKTFLSISHDTVHLCLSFPPNAGPWWQFELHTEQDHACLHTGSYHKADCSFVESCFEGRSSVTILYVEKTVCGSESVISHRQAATYSDSR